MLRRKFQERKDPGEPVNPGLTPQRQLKRPPQIERKRATIENKLEQTSIPGFSLLESCFRLLVSFWLVLGMLGVTKGRRLRAPWEKGSTSATGCGAPATAG
eukprot:53607-Amphidinium_carterae.1